MRSYRQHCPIVHLLEGHESGDLPELVEQPGAEAHVLRREVPGAARWVDVDDAVTLRRGGVAMGQRRGGGVGKEEEAGVAVAAAARQAAWEAGRVGASGEARAEEDVAKRRRR
jgi:hypothetical protein